MRIVYAKLRHIPSLAANTINTVKMVHAFSELGHKVTLIAMKNNGEDAIKDLDCYEYYGVKRNFRFLSFDPFKLWKRKTSEKYCKAICFIAYLLRADLVYTRCINVALMAMDKGHLVVFERHDVVSPKNVPKFLRLVAHKNLKKFIVVTQTLADHFFEVHNVPREKIYVACSGSSPMPDYTGISPITRRLDRPVVGYVGHLYKGRGINLIIDLAKTMTDVDFHIVGGLPEDVDYWKNEAKNVNNITFYGHVPPAKTHTYILNCDIILAPYQDKEGIAGYNNTVTNAAPYMSPLKLFEYMSSGIPIICSDIPVLHAVLTNNETAILCPENDRAAWQNAIRLLCQDKEYARQIGINAKEKFLAQYTWKKRAIRILDSLI